MVYDLIGKVAIIPETKEKVNKAFARNLLKKKAIEAVYARGKIKGRLRIPELKWLAGKHIKEVIHHESRCSIKLDLSKCYFSPRLSTDRLEIAKQIKPGEKVLVMFSGVGPYPLVISKNSKAKLIYGVELSRVAFKYAKENLKLNKTTNIKLIQGDVKKILPLLRREGLYFDRIVMPRPQLKESFLKEAFMVSKRGTLIHFYDFLPKQDFQKTILKIKREAVKARKKIEIIKTKKVKEIAPYKFQVRIDFKVK